MGVGTEGASPALHIPQQDRQHKVPPHESVLSLPMVLGIWCELLQLSFSLYIRVMVQDSPEGSKP